MPRKVLGKEIPKQKQKSEPAEPEKKKSRFEMIDLVPDTHAVTEPNLDEPEGQLVEGQPPEDPTEVVCVLDRSGSMDDIVDDAIGGFNSFLKEQQSEPGEATMTIVLFDDKYELLTSGTRIQDVKPLNRQTYVPRGSTSLNDAIGKAIGELKTRNPKNAIIAILTDGKENTSREYSKEQIKEIIKECSDKGWFVAYLSASIDAFADARSYGVPQSGTSFFSGSSEGINTAMLGVSYAATNYRSVGARGMASGRMSSMSQHMSRARNELGTAPYPSNGNAQVPQTAGWQNVYQPGTNDLNIVNRQSDKTYNLNPFSAQQSTTPTVPKPFTSGGMFNQPKSKKGKHTNHTRIF
jgi:hypothetical protein